MKFLKIKLLVIAFVLSVSTSALAAIGFDVTVDTSSLSGSYGYLYLQYGGINAVDSTAAVHAFTGGILDPVSSPEVVDGSAVTGQLPGTVVFANTNGINDYNHGILFGNNLKFTLVLDAPAFGGVPGGSSTFSLGLFQDEFGLTSLLGGTLFSMNLINDGSTSLDLLSGEADVTPTPVPAAVWLLGSGLLGLAGVGRRQKQG